MLATKISFMNEIANLPKRLEVDGEMVPHGVQALERTVRQLGYTLELLSAVDAVNLRQNQTCSQNCKKT